MPVKKIKMKPLEIAKRVRRFFEKSPDPDHLYTSKQRPNKKGQGFHLFKHPPQYKEIKDLKKKLIAGAGIVTAGIFAVLVLIGQHSTLDFTVLVTAMVALCGLIGYDIITRQYWEKKITLKLDELRTNHDRLTREVARNRSDIAIMKEGLGELALSVEAQGRRLSPTSSAEAQMIETIVNQLGAIGERPRSDVGTRFDSEILELEMAPPPNKPPPRTELDSELEPDFTNYSNAEIAELVRHAVRNDEIDVFVQPIVGLPQRKTKMHEIYARIRAGDGVYIPAQYYMGEAEREELVPAIDNLLLLRCLQMLQDRRNKNSDGAFILNISGKTLGDSSFMNDLVQFLSHNHKMASRLVFELPQRELEKNSSVLAPVLEGLTRLGVRFSMDRVRVRRIDMSMLKMLNIRFIKLDASWLLSEGSSNAGFSRIVRMKKQLDAAGIDLIVERIEDEVVLRELLDFNIDYGQGYLFGKPDHHAAYRETKIAAA